MLYQRSTISISPLIAAELDDRV